MRLSVSALAWSADEEASALALLSTEGLRCMEHVPARSHAAAAEIRARGLAVVAFQALLFGTTNLHLFRGETERRALEQHLLSVCETAATFGARALVFGSPKNRFIDPAFIERDAAFELAREFFGRLGRAAADLGTTICLEPNPAAYGCNFLTTTAETAEFVASIASPGVKLNVDAGALVMNGEDPKLVLADRLALIGHVHASEPELVPVGSLPETAAAHRRLSETLRGIGYDGVVSIEMMRPQAEPFEVAVRRAIRFTREAYGAD